MIYTYTTKQKIISVTEDILRQFFKDMPLIESIASCNTLVMLIQQAVNIKENDDQRDFPAILAECCNNFSTK